MAELWGEEERGSSAGQGMQSPPRPAHRELRSSGVPVAQSLFHIEARGLVLCSSISGQAGAGAREGGFHLAGANSQEEEAAVIVSRQHPAAGRWVHQL